ncbi:uncharacterized protein LOC111328920 isoform X2 [Stylophora pistillata]|uniref:uncharacterized protein LOC111328920 isoform X2 n=1 Tax=Stylophora pistillata TaxID=50429 RepID=UPI000C04DB65|nr:uncharacterized protein LOC111328920 isoform X2 [Stylophora pistillata]
MDFHRRAIFMVVYFVSVWVTADSLTMTQSLRAILNKFNNTRNVNIDPAAKQKARDYIETTFKDHALQTWTEEFKSNNDKFPGINVVGRLPGRYSGTRDDKIVLIGAHYDTVSTTPGVDDNGSGMTALLQVLKQHASPDKQKCSRDYTLLFVAFDLEENQLTVNTSCFMSGHCPCVGGKCGSHYFVQNFTQYLNNSGAGFQGAIVLETILNYNTTPNSQVFPDGLKNFFGETYRKISQNQFKGDFLALIGRSTYDRRLIDGITNSYKEDDNFLTIAMPIPNIFSSGRPEDWPEDAKKYMEDFFRSDHYHFWNAKPTLPAIFLTDSANFRGFMTKCYHNNCDNTNHVTPEMMMFLARTTDSVAKLVSNMTNEKCEMKRADCIQRNTRGNGEIVTPYHDTVYPNKLNCAWTISLDAEHKDLKLKFTSFELEESINCTADYVIIRDGIDKTAPLIGKYCGKTLPKPITASSQSLYIMFHSDDLAAFKGFKAEWNSTTTVTLNVTSSASQGYRPMMWQILGFIVFTTLAILL